MTAASAMLGYPLFIVQEAKASGSPAFKSSGRVDVDELQNWIANEWHPMPAAIFEWFRSEWQLKVKPTLPRTLGIAPNIAEASKRTGLMPTMILHMRDAGSAAFLD